MKPGKWMLTLTIVLLFAFKGFSLVHAASGGTLTLSDDISNAIGDMEYGTTTYQFEDSILSGLDPGDDVHLVADAGYESGNVGSTLITFSNFRLEGMDAENYTMPQIAEPIEKQVNIIPKSIKVSPAKPHIYYGQSVTGDMISEIADYSEQIVSGDTVGITAQFEILSEEIIEGKYIIEVNGTVNCDNSNYKAVFDNSFILEVQTYNPEVAAAASVRELNDVKYATLAAPEGYLISGSDQQEDNTWGNSIEVMLGEDQEGKVSYYLRNNDPAQTEYYRAISEEKTYDYNLAQNLPEIQSINIVKVDQNTTLNFWDTGVFGNGGVNITVAAVGTTFEQETKIYLGEDGSYDVKDATSELGEDGNYHYTAVFTYEAPQKMHLKAYAENSSGTGNTFTQLSGVSDLDGTPKNTDANLFVLDNVEPEVRISSVDGNYQRTVKADVTIKDSDSGIAKVEYLWDTEFQIDGDTKTDFVEYNEYSGDRTNYEFILPWEDAMKLTDGCHTLHLRITDRAGNICCVEEKDATGSDMFPPEIKKIEIRERNDSVFRFLNSSYYSNKAVEIAVIAEDTGEGYRSGIDTVTLNGYEMQEKGTGEYALVVSPDTRIDAMSITVTDEAGWSTTQKITYDSDGTGLIEDVNLIVEDDVPTVEFDFESKGCLDGNGQLWFGAGDDSKTLKILVADGEGTVNSGLYSLKITDNGEQICENVYSSPEPEAIQSYLMNTFEEGEHVLEVTVEDNAGNIFTTTCTFRIDRTLPVSGGITVESPVGIMIGGKQWFDGEDIITFCIDASDADSGLKSIELKVNEQSFRYEKDDFLWDDEGPYVTIDTEGIDANEENAYIITAEVADFANNILTAGPVVVYKDFQNPSISRITVEKNSSAESQGLNVLSHGVYTNDTLSCKVYAADEEFGSGIDYVTLFYEGLSEPQKGIAWEDGIFSFLIPAGEDVFEKEITVTAYDKFGKKSENCPLLTDAENEEASGRQFIMIETNEPVMSLNLPEGDGETRTDEQIWYRSDKAIELSVQDGDSGIYNISFAVNGVEITSDKNGTELLKAAMTKQAETRITEELSYVFDTDYLVETAGEASDGKYQINIEITDNAGNCKAYEAEFFIDKAAPQIDRIDFSILTSDGVGSTTEFVEELVYGYYFKADFIVTVNVSDELPSSGLNEIRYRFVPYVNGAKQEEITGSQKISDGKAQLTVPKGFKGQIFMEAFDNVANRSGEKTVRAFIVDNAAPDIAITDNVSTSYQDAAGNKLYVEDNSITVQITDMVSGIREIGYAKSAELNAYDRKVIAVNNAGYKVGDDLGDGWIVSATDANLVTRVTKTFLFGEDDNDVVLTIDAMDNSLNRMEGVKSKTFTVDKTNPIINVSFRDDEDDDLYYSQNRIADITVIERNFNADRINILIENTFGQVPAFSFTERSKTEYVAAIDFDEGDYTFNVNGTDLGNHSATVSFSGGNESLFHVDKTNPVVEENFDSFTDSSTDNSFNSDKTVTIKVTEHNFDPDLTNLLVFRKSAGAEHSTEGLADVTYEALSGAEWNGEGDIHTLSFTVSQDAVYRVEITPSDLAGNISDNRSTTVFEIDQTPPVVTSKNGMVVSSEDTDFLDIYPYSRKDEPAPTVEFEDLNLDHINYALTVYIPDHTDTDAETVIRPVRVYLEEDQNQSGKIMGGKFVLPDFVEDGVYALELTAVDVAGNESLLNVNTYARLVDQDVLAYIMESNPVQKTGLYSFQYENGDAISKRPDNFSDIKIFAVAKKDTDVDIVLRDNNGEEIYTNAYAVTDDSVYGMEIYYFTLEADYFKENFQDDTDVYLHLSVKNEGNRIDLGNLHIDNIAPDCDMPEEFRSWKWFYGEEDRTITLSNISELLDVSQCMVYDNGQEIAFQYSSENRTVEFTLEKGWHNVGIVLSDTAGNTYYIQERSNIHIGFFWVWIIGAGAVMLSIAGVCAVIHVRRKRMEENNE